MCLGSVLSGLLCNASCVKDTSTGTRGLKSYATKKGMITSFHWRDSLAERSSVTSMASMMQKLKEIVRQP